jgi:DNA-binding transcriptional ArsR family regulator
MKGQPSFYTITRAEVRYDKRIPGNAKLLYGEIAAMSRKEGCCWASNRHFAELYGVSRSTVTNWVRALERAGYITAELRYGAKGNVERRRLFIAEEGWASRGAERAPKAEEGGQFPEQGVVNSLAEGGQSVDGGWSSFSEENSTSDNITSGTTHGADAREAPKKENVCIGEERAGAGVERGEAGERAEARADASGSRGEGEPDAKTGREARLKGERESVKGKWIENYWEIYGEAPLDERQRALDKHIDALIGKIGVERILLALDRAKYEEFCLERGYLLKIILSENVVSRLLHAPKRSEGADGQEDYVDFFEKCCGLAAA